MVVCFSWRNSSCVRFEQQLIVSRRRTARLRCRDKGTNRKCRLGWTSRHVRACAKHGSCSNALTAFFATTAIRSGRRGRRAVSQLPSNYKEKLLSALRLHPGSNVEPPMQQRRGKLGLSVWKFGKIRGFSSELTTPRRTSALARTRMVRLKNCSFAAVVASLRCLPRYLPALGKEFGWPAAFISILRAVFMAAPKGA